MKNNIQLIAVLLGLMSSVTFATTYTIDVQVTSQINQSLLAITQKLEMRFPELTIAGDTQIGSACIANGFQNNYLEGTTTYTSNGNSLCPRLAGSSASFELIGLPNSNVLVKAFAPEQVKNGLSFTINDLETVEVLNSSGAFRHSVVGRITLVDPAATTTGVLSFNYDFEGYYQ